MISHAITFASGQTTYYYFDATAQDMLQLADPKSCIVITDTNLADLYREELASYRVLHFPAGESHKNLETLGRLAEELLQAGAHRRTLLVGFGGGVVTDLTGYLAASFMRGIRVAFVPTTLLAQVDAAVGGKNGVNIGLNKNMLGTVSQPAFILFAHQWLWSLPELHWKSGMAEVIKYGFIADTRILNLLQTTGLISLQKQPEKLVELVKGCVEVKNKIVRADEHETGVRCILNFGHTAAHAFELLHELPHGFAVGLGMRVAMRLSEIHLGLDAYAAIQLKELLERFGLPASLRADKNKVMEILLRDKKRHDAGIDYVLLEKPGIAVTKTLQEADIREALSVLD